MSVDPMTSMAPSTIPEYSPEKASKDQQPENTPLPMDLIEEGRSMDVREVHPEKAYHPRDTTEGISTLAREAHPEKAYHPTSVT